MVLITDVDYQKLQFSGGNMHYLRPTTRRSMGNSWASGSISYNVPQEELREMTPLPIEQFVIRPAGLGRTMEVPSSIIWSRLK